MEATYYQLSSDKDLVRLVTDGDHMAYMEIYQRYSRVLYTYGNKKIANRDEVKDLLQDVFVALWQNRCSLSIDTPLAGYLFATLRYMVIKRIARQKIKTIYIESLKNLPSATVTAADTLLREKELRELIESEITSLPEKMQQVFRMSREANLSHKEIALKLGLSEATVKKHVNNALKYLRVKFRTLLSLASIFLLEYFFEFSFTPNDYFVVLYY